MQSGTMLNMKEKLNGIPIYLVLKGKSGKVSVSRCLNVTLKQKSSWDSVELRIKKHWEYFRMRAEEIRNEVL